MPNLRVTPRSIQELGAALIVWAGLIFLTFCAVFWALTQRIEPALVTAGMGLVSVGLTSQAVVALKSGPPPPPPVPDDTVKAASEGGE